MHSARLKESIFVRSQIQEVLNEKQFDKILTLKELRVWKVIKSVCHGFIGNIQPLDYQEHVKKFLQA